MVNALAGTQHADFYALIPAYTIFFLTAALALAGRRSVSTWVALVTTLVAATANVVEDRVQGLVNAEDAAGWLVPLAIGTLTKFISLAVCAAAFAGWALQRPDKKWAVRLLGLLLLPTLGGALDPHRLGLLMALTFLLFAITLSRGPRWDWRGVAGLPDP